MKPYAIIRNERFVGRHHEWRRLEKITAGEDANIIVVYGRRRVGKTELIEQFFRDRSVLKFEGLQTDERNRRKARQYQIDNCLHRLAAYLERPHLRHHRCETWTAFFELLDPVIEQESIVLYFEEIQWLSAYRSELLAELKPFWDDKWRHRAGFNLILCGSSPSFIIGQLMGDKALYSRTHNEFHLQPFDLQETSQLLDGHGRREIMMAHLSVGGIVEYLKILSAQPSVLAALCEHTFIPDGYFLNEAERIFVSNLRHNKYYRQIIEWLARQRYATRAEIQKALGITSGGTLTTLLQDLEICGFIDRTVPLHLEESSLVSRYTVVDEYLNFYYRFVLPQKRAIQGRRFLSNPLDGLPSSNYGIFLGFAFERWCRKNADLFARIIGFSDVNYRAGAFFSRRTMAADPGFQIDLMFIRADARILIGEVKYRDTVDLAGVSREVERKKDRFIESTRKYRNYSYEKLLILPEIDASPAECKPYFDHVITLDDIFEVSRMR